MATSHADAMKLNISQPKFAHISNVIILFYCPSLTQRLLGRTHRLNPALME
jgi:hypothetical protein